MYGLYVLGECFPEDTLREDEVIGRMLQLVVTGSISAHPHQAVSLMFFEVVVRYARLFKKSPQFFGGIVAAFLDQR